MLSSNCPQIAVNHHEFQIRMRQSRLTNLHESLHSHYAQMTINLKFTQIRTNHNELEVQKVFFFLDCYLMLNRHA